jgi:hypothetical protein
MPVGLRELFRRGVHASAESFIAAYMGKHHGRSPATARVMEFVRSRLAPGESIRSDTLSDFVGRVQRSQDIARRINRGTLPRPTSYPLGTTIPDCTGYLYKTIWEIDFPSEVDPGENVRIRVPIEVHSDRPLSRAEIARDSAIIATEDTGQRGKYKTLQLGLEFNTSNPVYKGVVSAFRC